MGKDSQHLLAVGNYVSGQPITSSVTYWTTLAAGLAEYKISVGASADKAVKQANDDITAILGLDIIAITPKDPTDANNKSATLTTALEYGFAAAALSKWTALASTINKLPVHNTYTSIAFAQLAYDDFRYDGLLDGKGTAGTLKFGTILLNQTVYRHDIATALLNMAQDTRNLSGITTDKLLATALRLNDTTAAMYGSAPVDKIDGTGPIFSSVEPKDNSPVHGTFTSTAVITDLVGLSAVDFAIDGKVVGSALNMLAPRLDINTVALSLLDGTHILTVRATNFTGTTTTSTSHIIVSNKGTTISNVSPVNGAFVRGIISATVDVADPIGVQSVEVFLDGKPRGLAKPVTAPSLDIDTTVLGVGDGSHFLKIVATNSVGNSVESNTTFNVDNTLPVITATAPVENTYHAATFTASATAIDNNLSGVEFLVDGESLGLAATKNNATKLVDTTKYPKDGPHKLVVVASDASGNAATKTVPLFFDNNPPMITNVYPASGTYQRATFTTGATVSDASLSSVEFFLGTTSLGVAKDNNAATKSVISSTLVDGVTYTISIQAKDAVGFVSTATTQVIVDNTPTTSTVTKVKNSDGSCTITGTTSDATSGVDTVTINGAVVAGGSTAWSYTYKELGTLPYCPGSILGGGSAVPGSITKSAVIVEKDKAGNSRQYSAGMCLMVIQLNPQASPEVSETRCM